MVLLARFILIVDSAKPGNPLATRQMCSKLQSMLSYGKYQTSQISSNVTYASRIYTQNFLAYSSTDDLLIFIEPKYQINVYNAQTIQLVVNLSTTDVVIATSTTSLLTDLRNDLFFIYENNSKTNLISIRVCQVRFNILKLIFENNHCIETINIQYDQPDLRINGFTIKRDHAGTKKSLLFISTDIGLIYSIFDTNTGLLIGESTIMNETLNEGSIVLSSSGSIYYASKQEHLIYELLISRDFRLRYGKIIKTNAIKYPFGLITDECNHLYIATRSMILVMYVQTRSTIRSVFSKASDLPIILERLNSTTYVYSTLRKHSGKIKSYWMFNFLYFTDPERSIPVNRHPVVSWEEKLDFNNTAIDNASIPILWPLSFPLSSTTNTTKKYIQFSSIARKPSSRFRKKTFQRTRTTISIDREMSSIDKNKLFTPNPFIEQSIPDLLDDSQSINLDDNLEIDDNSHFDSQEQINQPLDNEVQSETHLTQEKSSDPYSFPTNSPKLVIPIDDLQNDSKQKENSTLNLESQSTTSFTEQSSDSYLISNHLNSTLTPPLNQMIDIAETLFSEDDVQAYLQGRGNLSLKQEAQIKAYLSKQSSTDNNIFSKHSKSTKKPGEKFVSDDNLSSEIQKGENSSINEDAQSQDYKSKRPLSDSISFNRTIDIAGTLFSEDDIQSYLEGRGNLSSKQEAQIQVYLANQSSSDYNIFSKYSKTTNKPSGTVVSEDSLPSEVEKDKDTSMKEDIQSQDYVTKRPVSDSKFLHRTTDTGETLISDDDVESYLQGRGNFTTSREAEIQAYLAKQLSSNHTLFSKYLTSTKKPTGIFISDNNIQSDFQAQDNASIVTDTQLQDPASKLPLSDSKFFNRTIDTADTIFSEGDVQSYLQGRANLSTIQEAQIQTYLAQKLSSTYNIFSKYSTSTKKPRGTFISNDSIEETEFQTNKSLSLDEHIQPEQSPSDPNLDYKHFNHTIDSLETTFSDEDLQSYLQGRGNLSTSQEAQIEAYLAKQSSVVYNLFSKFLKTTERPMGTLVSDDHVLSEIQERKNFSLSHDSQSQSYVTDNTSSDSKFLNRTVDIAGTIFSEDDIQSYLEGKGNLTSNQEAQIPAYLAKQSSSNYTIFSKYSKSTKPATGIFVSYDNIQSKSQDENKSSQNYSTKRPSSDSDLYSKHFDRIPDSDGTLISDDDLQSYLEGRSNLSTSQETHIKAFLARQSSSFYNIFSKYSKSTIKPNGIVLPDKESLSNSSTNGTLLFNGNSQLQNYSKHFNLTTDTEEILFSEDDLRSYLEGRANLSKSEEAQIQAYLAKQSSPYHNIFSKYSTSTKKPRRTLRLSVNTQPEFQREGNLSLIEDTKSEDYSGELQPSDSKHYNRTADSEEILFSDDDLKSYLQGHANLSLAQEAQIQAYLAKQSSPYHNIFSKYSTSTKKPRRTLRPGINTQPESQREGNLSLIEDTQSEDYSGELQPSDSKHYNRTTDSEEILFSDDDLKSYLQGRANLSLAQEAQIQAYLAKQSSPYYNLFSKYSTSTKKPRRTLRPGVNTQPEFQRQENLSLIEDTKSEDYSGELQPSDSKHYNRTTVSEEILFSDDDLKSYLQGRANLSLAQEAQIQAYLAKQSSPYHNIFSKYSTSTKKPRRTLRPGINTQPESQREGNLSLIEDTQSEDYSGELQPSDSKHYNRTTDSEEILFSDDDLKSYLQGRANLSLAQEAQIQAYLAKQSSPYYNLFSKYSTSTKKPRRTLRPGVNTQPEFQRQENLSLIEDTKSEDYSGELQPSDSKHYNRTTVSEEILFSDDDLKSYLQGRANLSLAQEAQIQAYLAKQSSPYHNIFSKYSTSTKKPRRTLRPGINTQPESQREGNLSLIEDTQSEDYSGELQPSDSKHVNRTTVSEEILFSEDDFRSYFDGRANLSLAQEAQIQAYLAKQSSPYYNLFSKYSTSTKQPRRTLRPGVNTQPEFQSEGNLSLIEDTQSEDYSEELQTSDSKHYNRTTDSEEILFSEDDLRSYLDGRANLSKSQEAKIQAYLARQSSSSYNLFSKYSTSTKKPRRTLKPGVNIQTEFQRQGNLSLNEDTKSEDYSEELLPSYSKHDNRTTDSKEILFSEDDLRSYLDGRANLSKSQEAKIQAYLAKQSSPYYNIFSKYSISTKKPRRTVRPGVNTQPEFQREGNLSLIEDTQSEDYSEELQPSDSKHDNRTTVSEEILFSEDDLRSYLEGQANLSKSEEAKIQAYLSKQSSSNQSIFSKYSKSTKLPTRIYTSDNNTHHDYESEGTQSENDPTTTPLFDSKYFNFSPDSEETLCSHDDLQSYLQGRGNLSLAQEIQIQAYLAKQISLDNNTLSRYLTRTSESTKIPSLDNKLQIYLEGQTNLSLSDHVQSAESPLRKLTSIKPYITRKRIGGRRTPQSIINGSDDFDDSIEQLSDIYTDSNDDKNISIDTLNEYSQLPTSTSFISQLQTDPSGKPIKRPPTDYDGKDSADGDTQQSFGLTRDALNRLSTSIAKDAMSLTTTSDHIDKNIEDKISHKHSSPLSVVFNVSSTLRPSAPFARSNTTLPSSRRSRLSSRLHHSLTSSSTKSPKSTRFLSSKLFSGMTKTITPMSSELTSIDLEPTTVLSYSTTFSSSISKLQSSPKYSPMQTTDSAITSNIPKRKTITTLPDMFSSYPPFTTRRRRFKSTITSTSLLTTDVQSLTTKSDQYTSKSPETHIEISSLPYDAQSTRILTTLVSSTNLDSSSKTMSDKSSTRSTITTASEGNLALSDKQPLETTEILSLSSTLSPSLTDNYKEGLISTQSSFELASTIFPHYYKSKTLSTLEPTTFGSVHPSPESTLPIMRRASYPSTTTTTTTVGPYRTRKQKTTHWQTQQLSATTSSTTTSIPLYLTTSIHDHKTTTSTQISMWHSEWNPLNQQEKIVIKPSLTKNDSNTFLTNDLLNKILNNISSSTNSSSEKFIFLNLIDLPSSSWNLSLNSNKSIFLDVALPSPIYSSDSNSTTNLTFTNIEANRFSTTIIGMPINLQIDRAETKQFSLVLDATNNDTNPNNKSQHFSDVIIGHVKSEQFELNLTKSDNMHVHIQQVDSETAELYLDSNFCTNQSSLDINLNLSKNGTIRYGNRKPIHIGAVFTRVHMLKKSCDREPPLTLFFDICERQNPCLNDGTCFSIMPNYDDISYTHTDIGHVGYKCHCPLHTSGEHCQYLQYPFGYCLNGGTLFQIYDRYNISIEKCICPIGFHGEHCEENIDNCIGIDCSDHGICEDGIDAYKCSCFDGFYGFNCERTHVQTVLLQAASRSFGVVAILLIAGIAGLVVASDIHTYLTRKQQRNNLLNQIPRAKSELFENSVLLLGFSDAPIEMNDLSNVGIQKKQVKGTTQNRKPAGYRQLPRRRRRRALTTFPKSRSRRYLI